MSLNRQGHTCVGWSEIDKYAIQTYENNFGKEVKNYGDATIINPDKLPNFDLLCAGFPCQSFSIAGKRKGFEDTRGTMFFEIARILETKRPRLVLLENVKGLLNHDKGKTFKIICETLNSLGYIVNYEILNSKNFGVPQNRERVFIICYHINAIVEDGLTEKKSLLKRTILDYLFQLFLQNLKEVQKLQETKSKDYILGYLCLKEISRNQKFRELVKIKGGLTIPTEERLLGLKAEDMWQSIESLLKIILEESYNELNKSITLTATNETIDLRTYTYSELLMSILNLTVVLRNSSKSLWKQILSFLILIKENTKYARIIDKTEERVRTDNFTCYESRILQDAERVFIVGNIRGNSRPEVFSFGEDANPFITKGGRQEANAVVSRTLTATDYKMHMDGNYVVKVVGDLCGEKWDKFHESARRVYAPEGISPTVPTASGGGHVPKIMIPEATKKGYAEATVGQVINLSQPNSKTRRGRVSNIAQTLDTGMQQYTISTVALRNLSRNGRLEDPDGYCGSLQTSGSEEGVKINNAIRRLTPVECERLQGFPDNWTQRVSNTQRYKQCGNAVTVNVVEEIIKRIDNSVVVKQQ